MITNDTLLVRDRVHFYQVEGLVGFEGVHEKKKALRGEGQKLAFLTFRKFNFPGEACPRTPYSIIHQKAILSH